MCSDDKSKYLHTSVGCHTIFHRMIAKLLFCCSTEEAKNYCDKIISADHIDNEAFIKVLDEEGNSLSTLKSLAQGTAKIIFDRACGNFDALNREIAKQLIEEVKKGRNNHTRTAMRLDNRSFIFQELKKHITTQAQVVGEEIQHMG